MGIKAAPKESRLAPNKVCDLISSPLCFTSTPSHTVQPQDPLPHLSVGFLNPLLSASIINYKIYQIAHPVGASLSLLDLSREVVQVH